MSQRAGDVTLRAHFHDGPGRRPLPRRDSLRPFHHWDVGTRAVKHQVTEHEPRSAIYRCRAILPPRDGFVPDAENLCQLAR